MACTAMYAMEETKESVEAYCVGEKRHIFSKVGNSRWLMDWKTYGGGYLVCFSKLQMEGEREIEL